jgi:hypothetical protein
MKKYTVKDGGKYWTRNGAMEGFMAPGIAGCYSWPLAGALYVKAHRGGEIVEVTKDGSGKTVEGPPWDGKVLILAIKVPSNIAPGSGIVGVEADDQHYCVYYEGNLYNADNLSTWRQRVRHAAGRLLAGYPTVARGQFPKGDLNVIGYYHAASGRFEMLEDEPEATEEPDDRDCTCANYSWYGPGHASACPLSPHEQRSNDWGEDPDHPREDWKNQVACGDTQLGYWEWVEHRKDSEAERDDIP